MKTAALVSDAAASTHSRFVASDGSVEAVKWLALVLMTIDHVNKYLFAYKLPVAFEAGRVAMPLFVLVLAYNLARPNSTGMIHRWRVICRLLAFGLLACLPYISMGTVLLGWWPLNIMFTLAVTAAVIGLVEHGGRAQSFAAAIVFALGGLVVEYWWPAVALGLIAWLYFKEPTTVRLLGMVLALSSLYVINKNHWALLALPAFWIASKLTVEIPRMSKFFYAYYPAHLYLLWALQ